MGGLNEMSQGEDRIMYTSMLKSSSQSIWDLFD